MRGLLKDKELFLFDLDGVFYKGKENRVKIGGTVAVEAIRSMGKGLCVLTNNSTDTAKTVWSRLVELDIPVREDEVLTSGLLTAEYLKDKYGRVAYYLVGERGLEEELSGFGHNRTFGEKCDVVVVGLDRNVTYDKLDRAARLVREGAKLVATHASRVYAYRTGPAMATGPLVKAIEYASRRRATVIGKPSPLMFEAALKRAGCGKAKAVMVGDQLDTDIEGAARAGIDSILVTSGVDRDPAGHRVLTTLDNVDHIVRLL
ncbi:MAG: HAD-IIA family hydrolase [Nitrososphaerota archaeon]|jgi:HAD superfamily hydrolase (TIGR01450 family)|nr:HAD-IIA family hydrolase [Nitrososphaerota archaeon]MDG6941818.1 HAD-IIA family hydrolase [Nitrososphaerota archaeon]MDG6947009.1 HAD-IIA family hydrolase [Nitrososphaerota archaeon]MDG6950579.1 HAD-IIA family hydrolase [Nitrososphaerota archaeon]